VGRLSGRLDRLERAGRFQPAPPPECYICRVGRLRLERGLSWSGPVGLCTHPELAAEPYLDRLHRMRREREAEHVTSGND
jgi:hypothetical protein